MNKLDALRFIVLGLSEIHERGLILRDFRSGNMINICNQIISITDLELCRPMNTQNNDTYGVLPYVAPEVLRGKEYTQASDIYGFGIIAYEICTGLPPYHDIAHDRTLAIKICQGLRPTSNYKIPQLILDIIHRWDDDPLKRPTIADEVVGLFYDYEREIMYHENTEICKQAEEADEINKDLPSLTALLSNTNTLSYTTHPQEIYPSRILDLKIKLRIDSEDEMIDKRSQENCKRNKIFFF
ncbi:kinase-like domain-containing protein [Rhizophagus diaphanus]|nr:kinase-like domain-containing protein [Rhizophagus diaphanus] [Rhizophagus sp. MUCL 43196]